MIRYPVVAGMFYPADPGRLLKMVEDFIQGSDVTSDPLVSGIVSPHAGYIYSGSVAGAAYASVSFEVETVVILAPSHRYPVCGGSVYDGSGYSTPLGVASADRQIIDNLLLAGLTFEPAAHENEHSAEVQIPFIQARWPSASIVIVLMGQPSHGYPEKLASMIHAAVDGRDNVLLVASSDLSHYHPYEEAMNMDRQVIQAFCTGDPARLREVLSQSAEACGSGPMLTLMHYSHLTGSSSFREICYDTSATASGDRSAVVGYFAGSAGRDK